MIKKRSAIGLAGIGNEGFSKVFLFNL